MRKHHPQNERMKRNYFVFLKEAKRQNEASVDTVAKSISRFETYTKWRDFKAFHFEQAVGFKVHLAKQVNAQTGKPLSKALISAGYDGVVTIDNPGDPRRAHTPEILDLTSFDVTKARFSRDKNASPESDEQRRQVEAENAEIPRAHREDGKSLPAPNGQHSNLNENQWMQTRTQNFRWWFGDWLLAASAAQRKASTFDSARKAAESFKGRPLINRESVIQATASRNPLDKMLSDKAVGKSENAAIHSLTVANLDVFFRRSTHGWGKPDRNNDPNTVSIHRFFSLLQIDGRVMLVKMTVKQTGLAGDPNPLYTAESIGLDEMKNPAAQWVAEIADADSIDPKTTRSAGRIRNLAQRAQDFN